MKGEAGCDIVGIGLLNRRKLLRASPPLGRRFKPDSRSGVKSMVFRALLETGGGGNTVILISLGE
ncbi:hypothetical protein KCP78_14550 [Salmonella enterica subsp. enterica]|nr:hypothetical protein KCP78_14550 [Salmonella enterica subsp. enterica]